jgi:predicted permease
MKLHLRLIYLLGVIVPRRLRADWRREWEAELCNREELLSDWDRLGFRGKFDLFRRSTSACWDAILLQPRRVEDEMFQDLRFGLRMLLKHKGFTIAATLSLALGIGANTAIFSLINAALLRTLPVEDPQDLVLFTTVTPRGTDNSYSYPLFENYKRYNRSFTDLITASRPQRMRMTEPGAGPGAESVQGTRVSGGFFSTLGVGVVVGRTLTPEDDSASNPQPVAVISYRFWQDRFARDPGVVGRKITLNDYPFTIVGVAPQGFIGFEVGFSPDLWWPIQMVPQVTPNDRSLKGGAEYLRVMGRLKPGANLQQARVEMDAVFQEHIKGIPAEQAAAFTPLQRRNYFERSIRLDPGASGFSSLRRVIKFPLMILMTIVALVLAIACANVANLLLARASSRRKEIAVRLAVGAGRFRLIRQLLTESMLLAMLSGALGLLFARWGATLLVAYLPDQGVITFDVAPDARVLLFTLAISLLTCALFGLAPAFGATRIDLNSSLKNAVNSGGARSRLGLNKALVVAQVAVSLFLLIGGGLFVRSLQNLKNLDAGFDRENLKLFNLDPGGGYSPEARLDLLKRLRERLDHLPGVQAASLSQLTMISGSRSNHNLIVEGYENRPDEDMKCNHLSVGPKFFSAMGIPLLQGRDFNPQELQAAPIDQQAKGPLPGVALSAVINQTMARYFFGEQNPIGRRFRFREGRLQGAWVQVIGVARDAKYESLREQTPRVFYTSYFQWPPEAYRYPDARMLLRSYGDSAAAAASITRLVREIDPQIQVLNLQSMNDVVDESLVPERIVAQLGGFFSLCALLLACIGLYGVMSYAAARRTQEIGIRMALGARGADVIRMIMRETMLLIGLGVVIGLGAALMAARLVAGLLYGLSANDPFTISLSTLLLLAVAAAAGFLPAKRASRVDPLTALRTE